MLDMVKNALEELVGHGIKVAKLHGSRGEQISHTDRRKALQDFDQPIESGGAHVLLLVLGQHSSGLTLNQARTAILMEPQLQVGAETQAAGRIARIGQRNVTRFVRLITQHTVEPHILRAASDKGIERTAPMDLSLYASINENTNELTCLSEPPAIDRAQSSVQQVDDLASAEPKKRKRAAPAPARSHRPRAQHGGKGLSA